MNIKRSKYGNSKTKIGDLTFDSKKEAKRWSELLLLQSIGEITHLQRQIPYLLTVNDVKICKYVADFVYDHKDGSSYVEDTKGFITPEFKLKQKLMKACYNIDIKLT